MAERRFLDLQDALIIKGVAAKHARRARLEIESHFHQLVDESVARGEPLTGAAVHAHSVLGSDQLLIDRFASQIELHAWSSRWTRLCFLLAPLLGFIAASVLTMFILVVSLKQMAANLHRVHVPMAVTNRIDGAAQLIFLWFLPILVAGGFAGLAYRQRIALRWPVAGSLILCGMAALINVHVILTGGASPGFANAGIGVSSESWPRQAARALATTLLVLGPLWHATRRLRRDGPALP